jgi:Ca2+-transporting ATPase
MRRPPRPPKEPIVTGPQWLLIAAHGLVMTVATLAAMAIAANGMGLEAHAVVTVSFLTLALAQIWHVFNMTEPGQRAIRNDVTRNPYVWGAILICLALIALACYLPPLAAVLKLTGPDARAWAVVLVASFLSMIVGRLVGVVIRQLTASFDAKVRSK